MVQTIFITSLISVAFIAGMLVFSIAAPKRRLWPVGHATLGNQIMIWLPTLLVFGGGLLLGMIDWNGLNWPAWFRWGIGLPLIVGGNAVVWRGVLGIGMRATSGEVATLKTDGLYRWSRNPQYVADMAILAGWAILMASAWVWPIAISGIAVLVLAPFAEEPWLSKQYGEEYERYRERTDRFIGWSARA